LIEQFFRIDAVGGLNMAVTQRALDSMRGLLKRYGPSTLKRALWDQEFVGAHWEFIDRTVGDCVYPYLERHAKNRSVLDLGCGPGNTANELAPGAYQFYLGVDISDAALDKARRRSQESGRSAKNRFVQGDFIGYVPDQLFEVILFRESLYHVPLGRVKSTLDRYAKYLSGDGVFIVRLKTRGSHDQREKHRPMAILDIIAKEFNVLEHGGHGDLGSTVVVFRPRHSE
jgi:SAM-dependent methyltransferase